MKKYFAPLGLSLQKNKLESDQTMYYIKNKDGSPRWIWTAKAKKPQFLKFYHKGSWKSELFILACKLVFALRLQHLILRKNSVHVKIAADSVLADHFSDQIFIFTGTPGPRRKYTLTIENKKNNPIFIKHAFESSAQTCIQQETRSLLLLQYLGLKSCKVPTITYEDQKYVSLKAEQLTSRSTNILNQDHVNVINEFIDITGDTIPLDEFLNAHQIEKRLEQLDQTENWRIPKSMVTKLKHLLASIALEKVETSYAHGDFTPWNMQYDKDGQLYIYDWELAQNNMPVGFDLIHFIFQKSILVEHKNWLQIQAEIENTFSTFRFKNATPVKEQLKLYLLVNTIQQLEIFANQNQWHTQVEWLLNIWNNAISALLQHNVNPRELLILDTFSALFKRAYAGLKLPTIRTEKISQDTDLDLCMNMLNAKYLTTFLHHHPLVQSMEINKKYSHTNVFLRTIDNQFLSLDLIHNFKRKSTQFLQLEDVLNNSFLSNESIKKVSLQDTARFLAYFYCLNGATIPKKYSAYEEILNRSKITSDYMLSCYYQDPDMNQKRIVKHILLQEYNNGIQAFKNKIGYYIDTCKSLFRKEGMVITFSGVDGAGKSTLILKTKQVLEKKLRKRVVILRHRPSLLPILSAYKYGKSSAENRAANNLPRQGENSSKLGSLLRFSYYYTDYLFGQFIVYIKHTRRGEIVLYDRYYFDFINDAKRSNIVLPPWIAKLGYKLLLKPNINIFLYADPMTIRKRKQELDIATITDLTLKYKNLFTEYQSKSKTSKFTMLKNVDLNESMNTITQLITKN